MERKIPTDFKGLPKIAKQIIMAHLDDPSVEDIRLSIAFDSYLPLNERAYKITKFKIFLEEGRGPTYFISDDKVEVKITEKTLTDKVEAVLREENFELREENELTKTRTYTPYSGPEI